MIRSLLTIIFFCSLIGGCAPLQVPTNPFGTKADDGFRQHGSASRVDGSMTEQVYHSVRQAKSDNGVVLQVVGDSPTARVLPLPEAGQSVYVSELLTQTGVLGKLGHVEATLYRHSDEIIGGIPMEIKMGRSRDNVQPASDYALQPGDRLLVSKAANPALEMLLGGLLGR